MNILVFEYITGGGMHEEALPPSLATEGELMLNAVVKDFNAIEDVNVMALKDYRLGRTAHCHEEFIIKPGESYRQKIIEIKDQIDYLLIIAPESGGLLACLCKQFSNQGISLLNSNVKGIELTSDKFKTYSHLNHYNIQQVPTISANSAFSIDKTKKYIVKPIDGAGCEGLAICSDSKEIQNSLTDKDLSQYIIQPFLQGTYASLSILAWGGVCHVLSCNKQSIFEENKTFKLKGCEVNVFDAGKYKNYCDNLVSVLPELYGYIGVDIIIQEREIFLIEINPRLTTSYVGIYDAIGINPAELILKSFQDRQLPLLNKNKNDVIYVNLEDERAA